jgi:DNA-binding transcriptional ArsR family regulator
LSGSPEIPDAAAHLLTVLREPRRLAILIALERAPTSVQDLARNLGLTYSETHWAVKELRNGNLIVSRGSSAGRSGRGASLEVVYETRHQDWQKILRALNAVAATVNPET